MTSSGEEVKPSTNGSNPSTEEKILKQIEYYFGDINLPRDKFLQEEMKKDDGWISLETMLKFNRLAKISTDLELITVALKDSHLIDVSEDNTKIRRSPEVPLRENTLEYWQEIKRRTVYLKGFPRESTLDEISALVDQYGDVKNILMRKTKGSKETPRVFKGSVFVTFANVEQAKKLATAKDLKFKNEQTLENKMQEEYWASKSNERQERKDLKKQKRKETIEHQNKAHYVKGLVLKLKGLPSGEGVEISIGQLKQFFEPYGLPAFAVIDGAEATLRFGGSEENAAREAWKKAVAAGEDGKVLFEGSELMASVLEGEEEAKYWTEFSKARLAKHQRQKGQQQQQQKDRKTQRRDRGDSRGNRKRAADRGSGHQQAEGKKAKHTVFKDDDDEGEEEAENEKKGDQNGSGTKKVTVGTETKEEAD